MKYIFLLCCLAGLFALDARIPTQDELFEDAFERVGQTWKTSKEAPEVITLNNKKAVINAAHELLEEQEEDQNMLVWLQKQHPHKLNIVCVALGAVGMYVLNR